MHSLCFVIPYIDFVCSENVINRLICCDTRYDSITVVSYDGSYVSRVVEFCKQKNYQFLKISHNEFPTHLSIKNEPFMLSVAIYERLKKMQFSEIVFNDLAAGGFHCIQSKRVGLSFRDTKLTIEMSGGSQYINELNEEWGYGGIEQLMVQFMERYCAQHCDLLLVSTKSMLNWATERRWTLCENKAVLPYQPISCLRSEKHETVGGTIIFCGPLGMSANLSMFINAINRITRAELSGTCSRIFFTGEYKTINGLSADQFIHRGMENCCIDWRIAGALNTSELIELALKEQATLVYCNAMSNLNPELLTAVQCGIPVMASDNPAHRELFYQETLFQLTPSGIVNALITHLLAKPYTEHISEEKSLNCEVEKIAEEIQNIGYPLVSIITAYFNHGKYIDIVHQSIENQLYKNYEWIVVDDCSTDEFSVSKFAEYKEKYADRPYQFLKADANRGPGAARNFGVSHAQGEYLVFLDSDNIAKPEMLQQLVESITYSGCDCLTCYFDTFEGEGEVNKKTLTGTTSAILGPCLEMGLFINVFGDVNFIIKKDVFSSTGGFSTRRIVIEDWLFLATLVCKGYDMDVISKPLFWYRILPQSNNSYGSEYIKQQHIIGVCTEGLPPFVYHLVNSFCRPALESKEMQIKVSTSEQVFIKLFRFFGIIFPKDSRRRRLVKTILKLLCRIK